MAITNWSEYTLTSHAKDRILTRFNITADELDSWLGRLLKQCHYDGPAHNNNAKYRLRDIAVIVNPRAKKIVTVYALNEEDDTPVKAALNPEVQSFLNEQFTQYAKQKRTATAQKIQADLETALVANQKMLSNHTSTRYVDQAWEALMDSLMSVQKETQSANELIKQAHDNMNQKE